MTASTVTALGPPARNSAVAASSNRALDRTGLGSDRAATLGSFRNKNKTVGV